MKTCQSKFGVLQDTDMASYFVLALFKRKRSAVLRWILNIATQLKSQRGTFQNTYDKGT